MWDSVCNDGLAERKGFEPLIQYYPYTFLAGRCLQPLGHLSTYFSREGQGRGELVFVNGKSGAGFFVILEWLSFLFWRRRKLGDLIIYFECVFLDPRFREDDGKKDDGPKIAEKLRANECAFLDPRFREDDEERGWRGKRMMRKGDGRPKIVDKITC